MCSAMLRLPHLKHDHGVIVEICHVDSLATLYDVRMFLHNEPADVGEEEAPRSIVGVSVSVGVLVMLAVVPDPHPHAVLQTFNFSKTT